MYLADKKYFYVDDITLSFLSNRLQLPYKTNGLVFLRSGILIINEIRVAELQNVPKRTHLNRDIIRYKNNNILID